MPEKIDLKKIYKGKRVLVTGHTGFKGSWLCLWLNKLGAKVHGYALPPATEPNLFELARVGKVMKDIRGDVRDYASFKTVLDEVRPEIVFHLAAQAIVRASYDDPKTTFETNILGTVNCLEALKASDYARAVVVITSDKCYENKEWYHAYRETDELGGYDPYSASKAAAEIVCNSYRRAFFLPKGIGLATARAGNVIGGGDWSRDRIVPDMINALVSGKAIPVRNPAAVRPWQHVLEPLGGYLLLGSKLLSKDSAQYSQAWNFGPNSESCRNVKELVELFLKYYGRGKWKDLSSKQDPNIHEAGILTLSWDKTFHRLAWKPRWNFESAVSKTMLWFKNLGKKGDPRKLCIDDIREYLKDNAVFKKL